MAAIAVETTVSVWHAFFTPACTPNLQIHILFRAKLLGELNEIRHVYGNWWYCFPGAIHNLDARL
ncbi:hypothetical protein [Pseudomonas sp. AP42]|uniref:hypothetical protein n=1 Tax=Pseudomonas sp. AP42 TaxID=1535632 RepID=UPI00084AF045|nr:hypothetical protein [Pseudomonas sp. AP42]